MPTVDMKIEDLEKYTGSSPKPADFDEFWDKSLAEMRAIEPNVEFKKAKFQAKNAECYDMYFTGVGGARIHVMHMRPANKEKVPAILFFHGYGGNSGEWMHKLGFVLAGYAVFAMDCRGQGGFSEDVGGVFGPTNAGHIVRGLSDDSPEKLLFRNIFLDTAELANIVINADGIDGERVYARGGSQGGGLTIACAALEPRIKRAAVMFPFLSDFRRTYEMNLGEAAFEEVRNYFRNYDPRHEHENEIFERLGYIDIQNLAPRVKAEVLMFTGLMDITCPPSTQYAVYNKLNCKKEHILYPDTGHACTTGTEDTEFMFLTKD